jgi:hypothetical protein
MKAVRVVIVLVVLVVVLQGDQQHRINGPSARTIELGRNKVQNSRHYSARSGGHGKGMEGVRAMLCYTAGPMMVATVAH